MEDPNSKPMEYNRTPIHSCGYLPEKKAMSIFIPLTQLRSHKEFSQYNANGYRRSGTFIYHPSCPNCNACTPIRVNSHLFTRSKSQKRCWNKNRDLNVQKVPAVFSRERYRLYESYINRRHSDGEMFPPSKEQFISFLCEGTKWCSFFEFRLPDSSLIALSVVDRLDEGIAPIYTFFSPNHLHRGLGTYCILWLLEYAKNNSLPYVYLGYWIAECNKMSYKCDFRPFELLKEQKWIRPD